MSSTFCCRCQRLTGLCRASSHALPSHVLQPVNATPFQCYRAYATTDNLPRVAQPSVWQSIIPKAFRNPENSQRPAKPQRSKEWNPATFFICVFLLIGSNAIQMLALKNEYSTFSRKTDAKIKLLKDVLDRVQRGENVDVEKALGTGDEVQEQEWKDVLRHLEEEAQMWQPKERKGRKKRPENEQEAEGDDAEKVAEHEAEDDAEIGSSISPTKSAKQSDFY